MSCFYSSFVNGRAWLLCFRYVFKERDRIKGLTFRGQKGQSSLRDILQPLVKEIIEDKNMSILTSPVDVYKQWINQMETETGKPSDLPYDVDNETAMKHPEVVAKVESSVKSLQVAADRFLNSIIKSTDLIPYGMKYVAMTLRESLTEKFPQAGEDDVLKVHIFAFIYKCFFNDFMKCLDTKCRTVLGILRIHLTARLRTFDKSSSVKLMAQIPVLN